MVVFKSHNNSSFKSHNGSSFKSHNDSSFKSHNEGPFKSQNDSDIKLDSVFDLVTANVPACSWPRIRWRGRRAGEYIYWTRILGRFSTSST